MIVVRPSVPADIPVIVDIEADAGELFRTIGLDSIAEGPDPETELLAGHVEGATAWTAELDGEPVGFALTSVVDGEAHLDQISVRVQAMGQGVGRRLIDQVRAWATGQGHDALTLTTFVDVPWNGPWYRRLGFEALAEEHCGPELAAIRQREREAGIDVAPRTAMRLAL